MQHNTLHTAMLLSIFLIYFTLSQPWMCMHPLHYLGLSQAAYSFLAALYSAILSSRRSIAHVHSLCPIVRPRCDFNHIFASVAANGSNPAKPSYFVLQLCVIGTPTRIEKN